MAGTPRRSDAEARRRPRPFPLHVAIVGLAVTTPVTATADLLIVLNKSDLEGSIQALRVLEAAISLKSPADDSWRPRIISTVATEGTGIEELVASIEDHNQCLQQSDTFGTRPRAVHQDTVCIQEQTVVASHQPFRCDAEWTLAHGTGPAFGSTPTRGIPTLPRADHPERIAVGKKDRTPSFPWQLDQT